MAKKALLVGLNHYPDPQNTLRGCLNDVAQMESLLVDHLGFARDGGIAILQDRQATTRAIVSRLHWLVDAAMPGDVLVFHYSGHGSQVDDVNGDEHDDGLDEIICPYDLDWEHPFTDDDLGAIVGDLPGGVNLTVVLDCCHSGTGLRDLPTATAPRQRYLPSPIARLAGAGGPVTRFGSRAAHQGAILIAGCRDDQVSADAFIDGDYHGALTFYLCQALDEIGYAGSYQQLARRVRLLLNQNGYAQVPQLEGPTDLLRLPVFTASVVAAA